MKDAKVDKRIDSQSTEKETITTKGKFFLTFVGAVIGIVNGFFGGGGGMICVPILEKVLCLPKKQAHASAIAVIFPISFASACVYVFSGYIQSIPFIWVGLGAILGSIAGAFLLKFLPEKVVGVVFSLIMIAAGVRMIL